MSTHVLTHMVQSSETTCQSQISDFQYFTHRILKYSHPKQPQNLIKPQICHFVSGPPSTYFVLTFFSSIPTTLHQHLPPSLYTS